MNDWKQFEVYRWFFKNQKEEMDKFEAIVLWSTRWIFFLVSAALVRFIIWGC